MRRLMWLTIGFGAACAFGAYFYNPWLLPTAVIFLLISAAFFVLMRWNAAFRIGVAICLGAAIGLSVFNLYDIFTLRDVRQMDEKTEFVSIEVIDYSFDTDNGSAFDGRISLSGKKYTVRVYLNTRSDLLPGQRIDGNFRFKSTLMSEKSFLNYAGDGIFLIAYQEEDFLDPIRHQPGWIHLPAIWRHNLQSMIKNVFPSDAEGIARALLLGDTTGVDYETDTAFKESGVRHVIAVSGLHLSILFGLIYLLSARQRFITALIGIPAVLLFAALVGFTPSITRAGIMQILLMLSMLFEREYDRPTALAFAVLTILAFNPMAITSVSFQLSVGSIMGIFLFGERINNWLIGTAYLGKGRGRLSVWICGSIAITISAMVFTTPLVAYYSGTISLIGIVTNLITLWAITIVFYGIILSCAVGFLWLPAAQFLGSIFGWLIRYVKAATTLMASVPMAAVYTNSVYIVIWFIFAYVLVGIYLLIRRKPAVLFTSLIICGLCASVALSWVEPMLYECRVTVLDVGQGQAILLQSEGKTVLVDCGGDYEEGASNITAETLLSQGIRKLDGIIITHYDADHAGGVPYLLTRVGAENMFLPYAEDPDGYVDQLQSVSDADVFIIKQDVKISFGSAEITIFAPVSYNSGNESSMCVLFQTENCDILITGDRSTQTEQMLLSRRDLPKLDVLIAGHHGSRTSTSMELLDATRPEYVFISVGKDNPYGHPAQQTIDRILEFGCKILRTDRNGTIIFRR